MYQTLTAYLPGIMQEMYFLVLAIHENHYRFLQLKIIIITIQFWTFGHNRL